LDWPSSFKPSYFDKTPPSNKNHNTMRTLLVSIAIAVSLTACKSVNDNRSDLRSSQEREITAGIVKREVRMGMPMADVAEALGSPNITSRDENGLETWIYDKIATEASYSESQNSLFLILGGFSNQSGAASTTQKTLTVVIKFDQSDKVVKYSYHTSKF
jgi:outer membrane protein assembly factor BamE (lipoprotein component of BamABCDE complex)